VIKEALTDAEILATYPVMKQLRPHQIEQGYPEMVGRMRRSGYRLAAATEGEEVRCVAGFRIVEFLAWGRFLYVDDLVTDENARSGGYGKQMLDWLAAEAKGNGCGQLHLDSYVVRHDTHRFYFREGMSISAYHFSKEV
jgi:GNAT superfamily N-acetyltransferase